MQLKYKTKSIEHKVGAYTLTINPCSSYVEGQPVRYYDFSIMADSPDYKDGYWNRHAASNIYGVASTAEDAERKAMLFLGILLKEHQP
jgi:hypothetical protein